MNTQDNTYILYKRCIKRFGGVDITSERLNTLVIALIIIVAGAAVGFFVYSHMTAEPLEYNVTYELNGGVNSENNRSVYDVGKENGLDYPTKEGYLFGGWYSDKECTESMDVIGPGQRGDVTLYAKWVRDIGSGYTQDITGKNIDLTDSVDSYDFSGTRTTMYMSKDADGNYLINYTDVLIHRSIRGNSSESSESINQDGYTSNDIKSSEYLGKEVIYDKYCEHTKITFKDGAVRDEWKCFGWVLYKTVYTKVTESNNIEKTCIFRDYVSEDIKEQFSVRAYGGMGVTVVGSGVYDIGKDVTLTATVAEGKTFSGWFDIEGNKISDSKTYTIKNIHKDIHIVARTVESQIRDTYDHFNDITLYIDGRFMSANWILYCVNTGEYRTLSGIRQICDFTSGGEYGVFIEGIDEYEKMICEYYGIFIDKFKVTVYVDDGLEISGDGYYSSSDTITLKAKVAVGELFGGWYLTDGTECTKSSTYPVEGVVKDMVYCATIQSDRHFDRPEDFEYPEYEGVTVKKRILSNLIGDRDVVVTSVPYTVYSKGTYLVSTYGTDGSGKEVYRCCMIDVGGDVIRHHEWVFEGKTYKCNIEMDLDDYTYYSKLDTTIRYNVKNDNNAHNKTFITYKDQTYIEKNTIAILAGELNALAEKESMDESKKANFVLSFVQSIRYEDALSKYGMQEYWKYPYETLYDMAGDYASKVFVYLSLMRSMGYTMSMLMMNNHIASAWESETNIYCESASEGYALGDVPSGITYLGRGYNRGSAGYCQFVSID